MKKFLILSLVVAFVLVTTPACKKFVWNPVGTWSFQTNIDNKTPFTVNITLTGNESGGSVTGWELYNPDNTAGTWTKSGDYSISITIEYVNALLFITFNNTLKVTGTTSKGSPNTIVLTGTFTEVSWLGTTENAVTITATKTSNLQ